MPKKLPDVGSMGVGDLGDILHNHGVSDLSWLDIDPEDYHKAEALPKQNLDVIPELQRALTFDDGDIPALIPLRPHTLVNTNPLDPPGAPARNVAPEITNRVARYMISGRGPRDIKEKILLEFAPSQIRMASEQISAVMSERGLLGNIYIDAKYFPRCAQDSDDKKFIITKAANSQFIIMKDECSGCIHNHGGNCANLHKRLVANMSYDRKVFASYALKLAQEGRLHKSDLDKAITGSDGDRRRVLQISFCSSPHKFKEDGGPKLSLRQQDKQKKTAFSEQEVIDCLNKPKKEIPVLSKNYIAASRHLMFGRDPVIIRQSTDPEVRKLASDHGLLGHTYLDMDALGGCKKTLAFMSKFNSKVDFVVRRSACCEECKCAPDGGCSKVEIVAPIVDEVDVTKAHFVAALLRAKDRGAITDDMARRAVEKVPENSNWRSLTAQANLLTAPQSSAQYTGARVIAHHGMSTSIKESTSTVPIDPEDIRRTVSHLMNSGLAGKKLQASVFSRYTRQDLSAVPQVNTKMAVYDGVQGSYFIDPSAYIDYGRGCQIGAKYFRKRGAPNVLAGEFCTGCSMQTAPGWCAKYSKSLIRGVPKSTIMAAVKQRNACPIIDNTPVKNPVEEYELKAEIPIEIGKCPAPINIEVPSQGIPDDRSILK